MKRGTSKVDAHLESTDGMGIDERGMFDEVNASGSSRPSFNVKKSATVRSFGKPQPQGGEPTSMRDLHGQANSKYHCTCSICHKESTIKIVEVKTDVREELFAGEERSFTWLLEHLTPKDNEKIRGCHLLFPDTVVFHKGRVKFIARTDKEGFLTYNKQA